MAAARWSWPARGRAPALHRRRSSARIRRRHRRSSLHWPGGSVDRCAPWSMDRGPWRSRNRSKTDPAPAIGYRISCRTWNHLVRKVYAGGCEIVPHSGPAHSCEGPDIRQVFEPTNCVDDGPGFAGRPLRESGTVPEFGGDFVEAHGVGRTAFAEVGATFDSLAILQVDFEDGGHLVVARLLGFGMNAEVDALDHALHLQAADHFVGELVQTGLAIEQQRSHAELHAEFGLERIGGPVVDQRVRHVLVRAYVDALHVGGADVVLADQAQQLSHAGVS